MNNKKNNPLNQIFNSNKKDLLSIYFTAGYPNLNDTSKIIKKLSEAGVDFIEVGSPYNDPIADGLTIQQSANQALNNGMSVDLLFKQLIELKQNENEKIAPLVWMGYFNLILTFGVEEFCKNAKKSGIYGLIVPDLPLEYFDQYKKIFKKYDLNFIFMISPSSSSERILEIDKKTDCFTYATSSQSITGQNSSINSDFFNQVKSYQLKNPLMIGFNIKDKTDFKNACKFGRGAIIGSSFINFLTTNSVDEINQYIESIKG